MRRDQDAAIPRHQEKGLCEDEKRSYCATGKNIHILRTSTYPNYYRSTVQEGNSSIVQHKVDVRRTSGVLRLIDFNMVPCTFTSNHLSLFSMSK